MFNTYDDDATEMLSHFVADDPGLSGPLPILSCIFALDSGFPCPTGSAFVLGTHAFPPLDGITLEDVFPNLPMPPVLSVNVSPRTPACGDGFQEGSEQCDDGNTTSGDCCSDSCALELAGSACDDGTVCTLGETCNGNGACIPASTLSCDDGDLCTYDSCDSIGGCQSAAIPTPVGECLSEVKAKLALRDSDNPTLDGIKWAIVSHPYAHAAIDDPTTGADYALCIYDEAAGTPALAARMEVPAGTGWTSSGAPGERYDYEDLAAANDGVTEIRIDARGSNWKARLRASGANLTLPGAVAADRYFAQDAAVVTQLHSSGGTCWNAAFSAPDPIKNTGAGFKAKSP